MSFGGREGELEWLNEKYRDDEAEMIRKGLRRGEFDLNKRNLKSPRRYSA